jgi:hypothetical protein
MHVVMHDQKSMLSKYSSGRTVCSSLKEYNQYKTLYKIIEIIRKNFTFNTRTLTLVSAEKTFHPQHRQKI